MWRSSSSGIFKTLYYLVTEFLGVLGVLITLYLFFTDIINSEAFLEGIRLIMFGAGIVWVSMFIINVIRVMKVHISEKKRYNREFLKKSTIGYEVGSFWDVVKKYETEEELAIIIGVNNRFKLDHNYLNNSSLVHSYISKFSEEQKQGIEDEIPDVLKDKILDTEADGTPIFEYGSIYVVPRHANIKYETALLSMCEPSKANVPKRFTSERSVLTESFERMFEQMPDIFTNSTIVIPLIGTSSSGGHLSHEEVAKYLISAFADYSRIKHERLAKRFILSIYDKDIKNNFINLDEIKRHIDYECDNKEFSYSSLKNQLKGISVEVD